MGQLMSSFSPSEPTAEITFEDLATDILRAKYVVALTGSGVSAESGIPTYRDPNDGLWQKYDMMECASAWGYWRSPHKLWEMIREGARSHPVPSGGHLALKQLEDMRLLRSIITQNVDGLHQDAGSRDVVEFHGSLMQATCKRCGASKRLTIDLLKDDAFMSTLPPPCSRCKQGTLKPDATLFGEGCPPAAVRAAQQHVDACDLLLVIGTSASVSPANDLVSRARKRGAVVIEINPETTQLTNRLSQKRVQGKASGLMQTVDTIKSLRQKQQQRPSQQQQQQQLPRRKQ